MTEPSNPDPGSGGGNGETRRPDSEGMDLENYWLLLDDLEIHREELRVRARQLAEVQSALKEYEDLLGDAPLGYVTLDAEGTIRECNQTASRMLGIAPKQAEGWSFTNFVVLDDKRRLLEHLLKCREGEGRVRTELTLETRMETHIPCQLVTRRVQARGGEAVYRTAILDLTDRRRIEDALQTSERRLSAAVEASGVGVFEHDIPFRGRLYVSHRIADILGYTRSELADPAELPRWIEHRLQPDDRAFLRDLYRELADSARDAYQGDVRFRHKNGSWRWIRIWAKATPAGASGSRNLVGVAMDVTSEKEGGLETERRARQLRALAAELYHVEERERRKLAAELHDNLAQLIVATKMKLGLIAPLQEESTLGRQVEEALQLLDRADESVRSLTFSLSPPVLDELGLTPAVRWLAKDMEKQFGLKVDLREQGDIAPVDPRVRFMLFRSIRELLINAAKHAETDRARVILEGGGSAVRVQVEDEGRGFDPEQARAEGSRGFGLFSIQERVESIGGKMTVWSAPGRGTRVEIALDRPGEPLDGARAKSEWTKAAAPHGAAQRRGPERIRVLLADDHELVRSALARLLDAQSDLQVIGEASDGESALELTGLLAPDVVLMDVTMAGIGGIEATRRIAKEHPETRVVGLSMHESGELASAMKTAGAYEYLRKSCPTHLLLETIRRAALDTRRSGVGAGPGR